MLVRDIPVNVKYLYFCDSVYVWRVSLRASLTLNVKRLPQTKTMSFCYLFAFWQMWIRHQSLERQRTVFPRPPPNWALRRLTSKWSRFGEKNLKLRHAQKSGEWQVMTFSYYMFGWKTAASTNTCVYTSVVFYAVMFSCLSGLELNHAEYRYFFFPSVFLALDSRKNAHILHVFR